MNSKNTKIITSIILGILIISTSFVIYRFVGSGSKEIKVAKNFIGKLYNINAINNQEKLEDIKYKRVRIVNTKNELIYKTIMANSFGIDLDKNYNVIGFANKETIKSNTKITVEEAKKRADKYLSEIYSEEVVFKSIKPDESSDELPYYSFIYLKSKNGYPFYFDEIIININKETGNLEGYANSSTQKEYKEPIINISENEAESEAINYFNKYNKEVQIIEKTQMVYADKKDKVEDKPVSELCYVVTLKGKNEENTDIILKIFISTENKEVINSIK
ncbi:YcdB/YcdC domain-containing protein [Clostridium weizhouense]|uniref:YcdB/YcdC repeated domain-containing protein n=1 Tax=Clostridium weizhouense TaxID=2859781 RepID=A0ABS7AMT1_9CLOT|nr:YcdB/YcdC domain-containing protein [Clostridium weizhouense]MBW6409973.1 hypothetical protein [Clostridium weizhouense]